MSTRAIRFFTLGADPEMICKRKGTIIRSSQQPGVSTSSEFGSDGEGVAFEIRPQPAHEPQQVVDNIYRIFAAQIISQPDYADFHWEAGSMVDGNSIGGHIHIGGTSKWISPASSVTILDNYVGAMCLLIEDKNQAYLRRNVSSYGRLGDNRTNSHGFEYRTPSSWLVSPHVAAGVLALTKTVMSEAIHNSSFRFGAYVDGDTTSTINGEGRERLLAHFPAMWGDIKRMRTYQKYKPYLDFLYFLVHNGLTWFPKTDMKQVWGLTKPNLSINSVSMDIVWARYSESLRRTEVTVA